MLPIPSQQICSDRSSFGEQTFLLVRRLVRARKFCLTSGKGRLEVAAATSLLSLTDGRCFWSLGILSVLRSMSLERWSSFAGQGDESCRWSKIEGNDIQARLLCFAKGFVKCVQMLVFVQSATTVSLYVSLRKFLKVQGKRKEGRVQKPRARFIYAGEVRIQHRSQPATVFVQSTRCPTTTRDPVCW